MTSRLRVLGLHAVMLCTLVAAVLATHIAAIKPDLPLALLDSFDQAFDLVYDAAERKVSELEAAPTSPLPRRDIAAILRDLEARIAAACDRASAVLDAELAVAGSLPPERRISVLGCIERHLADARNAAGRASDPDVRAEYDATCDRLREVRRLI
ncbi:MAG: hypothetical protein E6J90_19470 [Deltaproteobacteria bacterium]|nr:MAG: hypothetical protein E6J90_19470 [Deltaproteobacteria bacterium]TMQ22951.1 MAG: hypothetical protein E6J91_00730 [Deltaproteobacteria bacterium]